MFIIEVTVTLARNIMLEHALYTENLMPQGVALEAKRARQILACIIWTAATLSGRRALIQRASLEVTRAKHLLGTVTFTGGS